MKRISFFFISLLMIVAASGREYTWTGAALDFEWSNPYNWNWMPFTDFPGPEDDVIILGAPGYNYPYLDNEAMSCANLTIEAGGMLRIMDMAWLEVMGDANIYGLLNMAITTPFNNFKVYGLLNWQSGAQANLGVNSNIYCLSQMKFLAGSNVQMNTGEVIFTSDEHDCFLINNSANTELSFVRTDMTAPYKLVISSTGTEDFTINGSIINQTGSTISCNYIGNINLKRGLYDYNTAGSEAGVYLEHGNLIMDGTNQTINLGNPACYLNKLTCSLSGTLSLASDLTLQEDLTIVSGVFDADGYDISLGGDWSSFIGSSGFVQAGTVVTFNGNSDSYVYADENFDTVVLDKSGGAELIIPEDSVLDCDSYDWTAGCLTVSGGLFYASDLVDDAILGAVTLNSGTIVFSQDTVQYLDLRGNLIINGGEMHLWGGAINEDSFFPWGGSAGFTMSGGLLHRHTYGIFINTNNVFISNVSGGTIRVDGNFRCNRFDFVPTGGVLELSGSATATVNMEAGRPWNMQVSKTIPRSADSPPETVFHTDREGNEQQITRSGEVFLARNLTLGGYLQVATGILDLNGYSLHSAANVTVNGTLIVDSGAILYMASPYSLNVFPGGRLEVFGNTTAAAKITTLAGQYNLNVLTGGTIAASYGIFEYMASTGVVVYPYAHIDPAYSFTWCIFRYGASGGTLLTIDNADAVVIKNAIFPTNTWSGASNVRKGVDEGQVYLINSSGGFSGEAFDNDIYNRVHWDTASAIPDFMILGAVWSPAFPNPYLGDTRTLTVTVFNNSTVACETDIWLDLYYNLGSPPIVNQAGEQWLSIARMPALELINYTFTVTNYSSAGLWNSYLLIDSFNYVAEADETNNVYGPLDITWQPLPVVPVEINYSSATNQAQLSWTYPISVTRFNVYVDTNPYGAFSAAGGWTTGNSFTFTPALPKLFFKVKAERVQPLRGAQNPLRRE